MRNILLPSFSLDWMKVSIMFSNFSYLIVVLSLTSAFACVFRISITIATFEFLSMPVDQFAHVAFGRHGRGRD